MVYAFDLRVRWYKRHCDFAHLQFATRWPLHVAKYPPFSHGEDRGIISSKLTGRIEMHGQRRRRMRCGELSSIHCYCVNARRTSWWKDFQRYSISSPSVIVAPRDDLTCHGHDSNFVSRMVHVESCSPWDLKSACAAKALSWKMSVRGRLCGTGISSLV